MSDKREVDFIQCYDGDAQESVRSTDKVKLYYWEQNLGDYGICWVTGECDGKEVGRFNARHLLYIHFK